MTTATNNPKPRRRWLQFRLKTIFIVVAIVAVPCGLFKWKWDRKQAERRAVAAIRDWGANGGEGVIYDWQMSTGKRQPPGPAWLRSILGDDWFADVETLRIVRHSTLANTDLIQLNDVVQLETFNDLRCFILYGKGFKEITDIDLACLTEMKDLVQLTLVDIRFTDVGMLNIKGMRRLAWLQLNGTDITDSGLVNLKDMTALKTLCLGGNRISDSGLVHLRLLPTLDYLDLSDTSITDGGLVYLNTLIGLTHLRLDNTKVSQQGIVELQKSLPNCTIKCSSEKEH